MAGAGAGASARTYGILVELTDTLGPDFDVSGYLDRFCSLCTELLDVAATAVFLAGGPRGIDLAALHGEQARTLIRHELDEVSGPAFDCHHSGRPAGCDDFAAPALPWPALGPVAAACGIAAEYAVPMRWRGETVGVLALLSESPGAIAGDRGSLAASMASAAASGLLHHRDRAWQAELAMGLRTALDDAVPVEQAKGILAERLSIDVTESLVLLSEYAWAQSRGVPDVAADVVAGRQDIAKEPLLTRLGLPEAEQESHQASVVLEADPTAPRAARGFVAAVLRSWGLTEYADTARLLTSELVTNAVRHGRGPVGLRVSRRHPETVVEVRDHGKGEVRPSPGLTADTETGRGLAIVELLADRWGVVPGDAGKTVWFVLSNAGPRSQ
ncbi:ATP-binding protein [Catenulispora sp. NF23]|uniref:ATP-binding protein n=1 Tax=Catenulispora pinistramenti TaxID=2705254 RepID=A0ABS5KKR1_9ACTN|nr:ATP-binding protein [Catenulispora pinistramenti]MBS2531171.1 ATP-binding protein [Catenulispora pinistramenti]MBS2546628.1 ATP-binding protein [Catenulispora pinistramenti]